MTAEEAELAADVPNDLAIIAAEFANGLQVGGKTLRESHEFEVAAGFAVQQATGPDPVEVALDIELEQIGVPLAIASFGDGSQDPAPVDEVLAFADSGEWPRVVIAGSEGHTGADYLAWGLHKAEKALLPRPERLRVICRSARVSTFTAHKSRPNTNARLASGVRSAGKTICRPPGSQADASWS